MLSREAAIAKIRKMTIGLDPDNRYHAKLLQFGEFGSPTPAIHASDLVWAVEVQGRVETLSDGTKTWGTLVLDARTDGMVAETAGPGTSDPRWPSYPDHSGRCASTTLTPAP